MKTIIAACLLAAATAHAQPFPDVVDGATINPGMNTQSPEVVESDLMPEPKTSSLIGVPPIQVGVAYFLQPLNEQAGETPEKGKAYSIEGTSVFQKVDGGYLIATINEWETWGAAGNVAFLKTTATLDYQEALHGTAKFTGYSSYPTMSGYRHTVMAFEGEVQP